MVGERILVIGCPGSGKSVISKELEEILDLPLIHLDDEYYSEYTDKTRDEWENRVFELCKKDKWIMDGNYAGTLGLRTEFADTIVFLDYERKICMKRVLRRMIKKEERLGVPKDWKEKFDLPLLRFTWNFNKDLRPGIDELIEESPNLKVVRLFNDEEKELFLDGLRRSRDR